MNKIKAESFKEGKILPYYLESIQNIRQLFDGEILVVDFIFIENVLDKEKVKVIIAQNDSYEDVLIEMVQLKQLIFSKNPHGVKMLYLESNSKRNKMIQEFISAEFDGVIEVVNIHKSLMKNLSIPKLFFDKKELILLYLFDHVMFKNIHQTIPLSLKKKVLTM